MWCFEPLLHSKDVKGSKVVWVEGGMLPKWRIFYLYANKVRWFAYHLFLQEHSVPWEITFWPGDFSLASEEAISNHSWGIKCLHTDSRTHQLCELSCILLVKQNPSSSLLFSSLLMNQRSDLCSAGSLCTVGFIEFWYFQQCTDWLTVVGDFPP